MSSAAIGATPIRMKVSEILTGMDRGLIQGMGWPEYGMTALGLGRVIKYRLDPTYYRGNILTLVNGDAWKKMIEFTSSASARLIISMMLIFVLRCESVPM